jgi:hypothetical protein
MKYSPRLLATLAADNGRAINDAFRFPRDLQPPHGENAVDQPPIGRLREYFDSHSEGPGLWKWLHYFPIYERHFGQFVGRKVNIMEIGIYSGGSLSMWLDYFGDDAHVYGLDIEEACRVYAGERVDVFIGDQEDTAFWRQLLREVPQMDIVIDDGGHAPQQQIKTLMSVLPTMKPGGVYLCEDSHTRGHAFHTFIDGISRELHNIEGTSGREPTVFQQHVASIHRYPLVTVIEKPTLPVPRFETPRRGTEWAPFGGQAES